MYHSLKGCRFDFAARDDVVSLAPFGQELPTKTSLATLTVAVAVLLMLGIASAQQKTRSHVNLGGIRARSESAEGLGGFQNQE